MAESQWNSDDGDYVATTLAIGEEDGSGICPVELDPRYLGPPVMTTLALGEEEGGPDPYPDPEPCPIWKPDPEPIYTTLALGEEGGFDWEV